MQNPLRFTATDAAQQHMLLGFRSALCLQIVLSSFIFKGGGGF